MATAESIPVASCSADVVVCAQAFHWFDHGAAMPEIARVLRPGGVLALVWNARDEGIPWVRKLGKIIGSADNAHGLADPAAESEHFGELDSKEFRFWQMLRRDDLFDLVRSRSYVALLDDSARDQLLARVGALYDDYGRGPDGMQLPYITRCYRTVVRHRMPPPVPRVSDGISRIPSPAEQTDDPGTLLIDFK